MEVAMRPLFASHRWRLVMSVALLVAFAPNALFMEHWAAGSVEAVREEVQFDEHAQHRPGGAVPSPQNASGASEPTHCHVGPESCAASSGLSNAIVIAAALALTLLGGSAFLLDLRSGHVSLFDLSRRLIVPPRLNPRSI
jgi:hypothetical protein